MEAEAESETERSTLPWESKDDMMMGCLCDDSEMGLGPNGGFESGLEGLGSCGAWKLCGLKTYDRVKV